MPSYYKCEEKDSNDEREFWLEILLGVLISVWYTISFVWLDILISDQDIQKYYIIPIHLIILLGSGFAFTIFPFPFVMMYIWKELTWVTFSNPKRRHVVIVIAMLVYPHIAAVILWLYFILSGKI